MHWPMGIPLADGRPVGRWMTRWPMGDPLADGQPIGRWAYRWPMGEPLADGRPIGRSFIGFHRPSTKGLGDCAVGGYYWGKESRSTFSLMK